MLSWYLSRRFEFAFVSLTGSSLIWSKFSSVSINYWYVFFSARNPPTSVNYLIEFADPPCILYPRMKGLLSCVILWHCLICRSKLLQNADVLPQNHSVDLSTDALEVSWTYSDPTQIIARANMMICIFYEEQANLFLQVRIQLLQKLA